jgi:hypothetical protein
VITHLYPNDLLICYEYEHRVAWIYWDRQSMIHSGLAVSRAKAEESATVHGFTGQDTCRECNTIIRGGHYRNMASDAPICYACVGIRAVKEQETAPATV